MKFPNVALNLWSCGPATEPINPRIPKMQKRQKIRNPPPHPGLAPEITKKKFRKIQKWPPKLPFLYFFGFFLYLQGPTPGWGASFFLVFFRIRKFLGSVAGPQDHNSEPHSLGLRKRKCSFVKWRFWRVYPHSGSCQVGVQEYQKAWLSSARVALQGQTFWRRFRYRNICQINPFGNHPLIRTPDKSCRSQKGVGQAQRSCGTWVWPDPPQTTILKKLQMPLDRKSLHYITLCFRINYVWCNVIFYINNGLWITFSAMYFRAVYA